MSAKGNVICLDLGVFCNKIKGSSDCESFIDNIRQVLMYIQEQIRNGYSDFNPSKLINVTSGFFRKIEKILKMIDGRKESYHEITGRTGGLLEDGYIQLKKQVDRRGALSPHNSLMATKENIDAIYDLILVLMDWGNKNEEKLTMGDLPVYIAGIKTARNIRAIIVCVQSLSEYIIDIDSDRLSVSNKLYRFLSKNLKFFKRILRELNAWWTSDKNEENAKKLLNELRKKCKNSPLESLTKALEIALSAKQ